MSLPKEEAWFHPKKYGYGWGLPKRWQGWLVFVGYLVALIVPTFFLRTPKLVVAYLVYVTLLSVVLVAICLATGEKPTWRWGDKPDE
ncbi:MAG TPA: hypothetical protein VHO24_12750 [Opitutaceae bacterium]|nr:hypothetical protein [Opitutaceae bacterium]